MNKFEIKENDVVKLKSGLIVTVLAISKDGEEVWGEKVNEDVYFSMKDIVEVVYRTHSQTI